MKAMWVIGLTTSAVLVLCTGRPADAVISGQCPGGMAGAKTFVVPDEGTIPGGYSNTGCTLFITASIGITPNLSLFYIQAKAIIIWPPSGAGPVEIVNDTPGGDVVMSAPGGDIIINRASIRARGQVNIACAKAGCIVAAAASELIASSTLSLGGSGGALLVSAKGDVSLVGTTVWGGGILSLNSIDGSTTLHETLADSAAGGCKDPTIPPFSDFIKQHCTLNAAQTEIVSCAFSGLTANDLRSLCCPPTPCPDCAKPTQWDISARGDVHIENSIITPNTALVIGSRHGRVSGAGATIQAAKLTVAGDGSASPVVDLRGANLAVTSTLRIVAADCPPLPQVCIDLTGATVTGKPMTISADHGTGMVAVCAGTYESLGPQFPSINGIAGKGAAPAYDTTTTLHQAAQCAASGGAGTFIHH